MRRLKRLAWSLALVLTLLAPALCLAWQGKVVGISDGDTITVLHGGKGEKIRLYGVDTPERRQDFGTRARQFTSDMVFGKMVEVVPVEMDRYGRTVGLVDLVEEGGQNLNEELVRAGMAWVYRRYCDKPECAQWARLEEEARKEKRGLWSIPAPVPPWEFRRPTSKSTSQAVEKPSPEAVYHGNRSSRIFHQSSCRSYNCKECTVTFKTREEALAAGFKPCGTCKP